MLRNIGGRMITTTAVSETAFEKIPDLILNKIYFLENFLIRRQITVRSQTIFVHTVQF